MRKLLSFVFLILGVLAAVNFRLSTSQTVKLNIGDSLISTLGLFKATLLQSQCTLSIETFNGNNAYTKVGNYTSTNYTGNCNFLNISEGKVITDTNFTYMYVGDSFNLSTILTIDDVGIIRLIGTYQNSDYQHQTSKEMSITTYKTNQSYIFPVSQYSVAFGYNFPGILNQRNWYFSAGMGQFRIEQNDDYGIVAKYSYSRFTVANSEIQDFSGDTFPKCIFPNITYIPRCYEPRLYLNFKPPFTLVYDPFWPIATVYEQGRYKILQISIGSVYEPYSWQNNRRLFTRNEHSPCPPYTFQFRGGCVTTCPYPYYHERRAQNGYCVLTCEEFTPKNDTTRICSCHTDYQSQAISIQQVRSCPDGSIPYPYGCYCNQTGFYFDRLYSLSCVQNCPQTTYADKGLCMSCPKRCLTCQEDKLYRTFLECKVCESGYDLVGGQCHRSCSPGMGRSVVSGICQPCSDPNCLNCSISVSICSRCSLMYAVSNNACVKTCLNNAQITFYDTMNSKCINLDNTCSYAFSTFYKETPSLKCVTCLTKTYLHNASCVDSCPSGYKANSNNYCVCTGDGVLTVNDQCMKIPVCPTRMGWDPPSSSCLSCSFGCLTCYDNVCTSCNPGFFLYVSPQGVFCRRKSPLYTCDQQFGMVNGVCILLTYTNPLYRLSKCLSSVQHCQACYPNSDTICVSCSPGFYNINNTCQSSCPNQTIPYNGITCIYPQITNCATPYFQIRYEPTIVNQAIIDGSDPYQFYIFNGKQMANDPVGYIPNYQNLTVRKTDGYFRDSQFFEPSWTCLKCNVGYGLSSDFKACVACPQECETCYMALNTSCLTTKVIINTTCESYTDYETKKCVQNCSSSDKVPYFLDGILYCYPASKAPSNSLVTVDSSTFLAADGTSFVFFIVDKELDNSQAVTIPISKETSQPRVSANGVAKVGTNVENVKLSKGYLFLKDSDPSNQLWIMNATSSVQNIKSSSNLALSNTVYGVSSSQGHSQFMKTWLAYIGYIMGLVLICLHVVFVGNDLLYKVDNTLILAQTIYFFSFVQLLVGKLLSQFYYGWLFAFFGFFPNFFSGNIPSNYVELDAPNSYKLATMDANIVRNAGWAFSLLLVFIGAYAIITLICWMLSYVCNKPDAWHPRIAVNSLLAFTEFLSYPIFYWAVANLLYIGDSDTLSASFYRTSKSVSICFIVLIAVYSTIRWFFNPLGGLYMYKRIVVATILAGSYLKNIMLVPLLISEVVFCVCRYIIEKPDKKKYLATMLFETLLHVGAYLLMFLSLDPGLNTIAISIIIFIMIVVISYSLTSIFLESKNQWELEEKEQSSQDSIAAAEVERRKSNIDGY